MGASAWESPLPKLPRGSVRVSGNGKKQKFKLTLSRFDFEAPPSGRFRVSIVAGNDHGAREGQWRSRESGVFTFR